MYEWSYLVTLLQSLGQSDQSIAEDLKWYFIFAFHKVIIYLYTKYTKQLIQIHREYQTTGSLKGNKKQND